MSSSSPSSSPPPLIPPSFWFRFGHACPRFEGAPRPGAAQGERLLDLPASCLAPAPAPLPGAASWVELRTAWNASGLAIAVTAAGRTRPLRTRAGAAPTGADLWIDTRDARENHRASRFCHRFEATIESATRGGAIAARVVQKPIARAMADAPQARPETIEAQAQALPDGWRLELFFHAEALHGFEPETCRRLGWMLVVRDEELGETSLGPGKDFPIETDPSLWTVLELVDAG